MRVWHLDMNDQLHGFLTWGKVVRAADCRARNGGRVVSRYAFSTRRGNGCWRYDVHPVIGRSEAQSQDLGWTQQSKLGPVSRPLQGRPG